MQQVRNAAELACYPAKSGDRTQTSLKRRKLRRSRHDGGRMKGSARLKIAFPAPFKAMLEPAQHIEARIT
jgi:hypothetical protein